MPGTILNTYMCYLTLFCGQLSAVDITIIILIYIFGALVREIR